jgi:tetratricopeptide (TPR) repeat protein
MKFAPLGILLGLVIATMPSPTHADEATVQAREHFRRGTTAYNLGHFLEAASEYEKAYEAKESPALLYNLGQAYRGAGEHQKALNSYRAYLREQPDAPNREEVAKLIEGLKHTIELQKQTTEKPPVGTISPEPRVVQPAPPPAVVTPPPKKREPDKKELALGRKLRFVGIGVGAFGVASLVVGGIMAGQTASINHQLNNPPVTKPAPIYNKPLESKGRVDQALETTFFVVGGVAAAAGVTALIIGTQKVQRNTFALAPSVGPSHVGATFRMGF